MLLKMPFAYNSILCYLVRAVKRIRKFFCTDERSGVAGHEEKKSSAFRATKLRWRCPMNVTVNSTRSWPAAELFPLMLPCSTGLNLSLAAPVELPSSKTVPRMPRQSPQQPSPANLMPFLP